MDGVGRSRDARRGAGAARRSPGELRRKREFNADRMPTRVATLTDAQHWVLGVGALLTQLQGGSTRLFGGGVAIRDALRAREVLAHNAIRTVEDVYRAFNDWLAHIPEGAHVSRRVDSDGDVWVAFRHGAAFTLDEDDPTAWHGHSKLGWNLMRACNVAGLAHVACLIPSERAWQVATFAAQTAQKAFQSWDELWRAAKGQAQIPDAAGMAAREVLTGEGNAWTLPWDVPLLAESCPESRTTWTVSAEPEPNTHTFEQALAQARPGDRLELRAGTYVGPWHLHQSIEIVGQAKVECRAPAGAPASVVVFAGFARVAQVEIVAPGDAPNGQVAVACMGGTTLLDHSQISSAGHGISVASAATATLRHCTIEGCQLNGVVSHGELEAEHSTFRNSTFHGAIIDARSRATLSNCKFEGGHTHLLGVEGESSVRAVDCTFDDSAQAAIVVTGHSSLDLVRCSVNRGGIAAVGAARCFLLDSRFCAEPLGADMQSQLAVFSAVADTQIAQCEFVSVSGHALHLSDCAAAAIDHTRLVGGNGSALVATSQVAGNSLTIQRSELGTRHGAFTLQLHGGCAALTGCVASGGTTSTVIAAATTVTLQECELTDAGYTALQISAHGMLVARGLRISAPERRAVGVVDALAQLFDCTVRGANVVALDVEGTGTANLFNCTFGGEGQLNVSVGAPGPIMLHGLRVEPPCQLAIDARNGAQLSLVGSGLSSRDFQRICLGEHATLNVLDCPELDVGNISVECASSASIHAQRSDSQITTSPEEETI